MIDFTKPVRTIGGKVSVKIISTEARYKRFNVVGYIGPHQEFDYWDKDGVSASIHTNSLENVPEKISGWINFYPNQVLLNFHPSREEADESAHADRIACVFIGIEEGQGL